MKWLLIFVSVFSSVWAKTINSLPKSLGKVVSLTFDDGPSAANTKKILAILKKFNIQATFFVLGEKAKLHPEIIKTLAMHGHSLGNHSYSHLKMTNLSESSQKRELEKTAEILNQILPGYKINWFRPPYGSYNKITDKLAKNMGMDIVLWSIDPRDWKNPPTHILKARILNQLKPGAIIVLHDIKSNTADALEEIIVGIKEAGYSFVPLSLE